MLLPTGDSSTALVFGVNQLEIGSRNSNSSILDAGTPARFSASMATLSIPLIVRLIGPLSRWPAGETPRRNMGSAFTTTMEKEFLATLQKPSRGTAARPSRDTSRPRRISEQATTSAAGPHKITHKRCIGSGLQPGKGTPARRATSALLIPKARASLGIRPRL